MLHVVALILICTNSTLHFTPPQELQIRWKHIGHTRRWLPIPHMFRHKRSRSVYLIFRSFGGVVFFLHPRTLRSALLSANGAGHPLMPLGRFWSWRPQISKVGWYTYNTSLLTFWIFLCNFFWSNVACRWPYPYLHQYCTVYFPNFPPPWDKYDMKAHWTHQALATYSSYCSGTNVPDLYIYFSAF